ncbi:CPBP family intramembrane metalloprotease, partial [Acidovorax sp. HMWF029]
MQRTAEQASGATGRFGWIERPGREFPFFNNQPVRLSTPQWLLLMAAVVAGFLVVTLPIAWPWPPLGRLVPSLLMAAIPLWALRWVAPGHWQVLFARVSARDVLWMFFFALLNIVVTVSVGLMLASVMAQAPNPGAMLLQASDTGDRVIIFANMAPQLLGEEVITVLPFLALMALFTQRWG